MILHASKALPVSYLLPKNLKAIWLHRLLCIKEKFIIVIMKSCEVNITTRKRKRKQTTDTY